MSRPIPLAVLAAYVPAVLILFRALGPRRAVPIALLGGFLLLPRSPQDGWTALGMIVFDKRTLPGLSAALGVVLFDRRAIARLRPSAVDLPMLAYILAPLLAAAANGAGALRGSVQEAWYHLAEWGLVYAMGRAYYGDADGPRRLAAQVVLAGLLSIPVVLFEGIMGPRWYLGGLLYRIRSHEGMVNRLGGWRPEALLSNGLELAEWMALAAVLATWLWACRRRGAGPIPPWLPAPALAFASLMTRGVYGYAALAIGLATTALTRAFGTRLFLMALTLVPPAYVAARASGLWDARPLIALAGRAGNLGTTKVRIEFEDRYMASVAGGRVAFGLGGKYHDWGEADGRWVVALKGAGLFGVIAQYAALMGPAALLIWRREDRAPAMSPEMGLALFVVLHAVDSLHNTAMIVPAPLISGSLSALVLGVRARASAGAGNHMTYRLRDIAPAAEAGAGVLARVGFVLAAACLLYVFGHAPAAGQEGARFVGGLGSALLFASVGAAVAGAPRRPLARAAAFGLAFAALGVSFNLALHPTDRPAWSADILQGLALSGLAAAAWRRATGGGAWAFAGFAALAASWWAFGPHVRPFPGSQYLFAAGDEGLSLFPVLPWLALTALGAILAGSSAALCASLAVGFGTSALLGWGQGPPFGPPVKFPMNATYALLGASAASAAFAISGPARHWGPIRAAADWLGRRWLVFFYVHLGIASALEKAGLTRPAACWAALAGLTVGATWLASEATGRFRSPFRRAWTWAALGASTLAVGLVPGVPPAAVLAVAGGAGLLFASRYDDLAALTLGPPLAEARPRRSTRPVDGLTRYLARVSLVVAVLAAPELVGRLPAPFGKGTGPEPRPPVEGRAAPDPARQAGPVP